MGKHEEVNGCRLEGWPGGGKEEEEEEEEEERSKRMPGTAWGQIANSKRMPVVPWGAAEVNTLEETIRMNYQTEWQGKRAKLKRHWGEHLWSN